MTTAYDPNATDDTNAYDDGTYTAEESAPSRGSSSDLPDGTYTARAIQWAWDEKKDGEPCLAFLFELTSGKPGYRLDGRLYLDESKPDAKGRTALSRTMEVLSAMGLQGPIPADLSTVDLSIGEVSLVVEINEKGYPQVKFVNAPRAPRELRTFATPAPQKVNAFVAKLNARVAAMTAAQRASGAAPIAQGGQSARQPQNGQNGQNSQSGQNGQPTRQAQPSRPVANGQNARPMASSQSGQTNANARPVQPQRQAPPPRVQGQGMGEFAGAEDEIPF